MLTFWTNFDVCTINHNKIQWIELDEIENELREYIERYKPETGHKQITIDVIMVDNDEISQLGYIAILKHTYMNTKYTYKAHTHKCQQSHQVFSIYSHSPIKTSSKSNKSFSRVVIWFRVCGSKLQYKLYYTHGNASTAAMVEFFQTTYSFTAKCQLAYTNPQNEIFIFEVFTTQKCFEIYLCFIYAVL